MLEEANSNIITQTTANAEKLINKNLLAFFIIPVLLLQYPGSVPDSHPVYPTPAP